MDDTPVIQLRDLHKRFGELVVLDGVSIAFPRGKTTAIIGPSGTGKSVLLKHIIGLIEPDSGQVLVFGTDMATADEATRYGLRKRFGMLFQHSALFDNLTVGENVVFPLRYHTSLSDAELRAKGEETLDLVDLPDFWDRPTSGLSGGQRKRVGLARAIITEPDVILFDEPNSGLDPLTSDTIDALILRMKERLGITFIVITHDIVSCVNIADYIGMLWNGSLIEYGPTPEFLRSEKEMVRSFMQRNVDLPDPA